MQITNNVVKTQSANATLALGGSPIMAAAVEEQADLALVPGGLLINFGTIEDVDSMIVAGQEANKNRKPIVFDPVGVGATSYRRVTAESEIRHIFFKTFNTVYAIQSYWALGKPR